MPQPRAIVQLHTLLHPMSRTCPHIGRLTTPLRTHRWPHRHARQIVRIAAQNGKHAVQNELRPASIPGGAPVGTAPSTAKQAVETGLQLFGSGQPEAALRSFQQAMQLSPDEDEARAALYNAACAHTKLKQWDSAVECAMKAINDYDLKLVVALRVRCYIDLFVAGYALDTAHLTLRTVCVHHAHAGR